MLFLLTVLLLKHKTCLLAGNIENADHMPSFYFFSSLTKNVFGEFIIDEYRRK